jgi:hypothetical protein
MADSQLDGSFSGLWSCEICGRTGSACTCEHFNRFTGAWGPDKTLTEAEMASEYWRMVISEYRTGLEAFKEHAKELKSRVLGADTRREGYL